METKYELRELCSTDIFLMTRIIGKIGVKNFKKAFANEEVKDAISKLNQEADKDSGTVAVGLTVMLEIADVIISNLPNVEDEIYQFLANLSGLKVKDIQKLSIVSFMGMIVEVLQKPEFKDFFKVASKLFK